MNAIEYVKAQKRMFLSGNLTVTRMMEDTMDPEVLVNDVERWSAAHPSKTRQSVFLEQWPEARIDKIFPCLLVGKCKRTDQDQLCCECVREFWSQEVE